MGSQLTAAMVGIAVATISGLAVLLAYRWMNPDETRAMKPTRKEKLKAQVAGYIKRDEDLCSEPRLRYSFLTSLRREWREHSERGAELKDELKSEFGQTISNDFGDYLATSSFGKHVAQDWRTIGEDLMRQLERKIEEDKELGRRRWRKNIVRVAVVLTLVIASAAIAFAAWALVRGIIHSSPTHVAVSTQEERPVKRNIIHVYSTTPGASPHKRHRVDRKHAHKMSPARQDQERRSAACTSCRGNEARAGLDLPGQVAHTVYGIVSLPTKILSSVGSILEQTPVANILEQTLTLTQPSTSSSPPTTLSPTP